MATESTQKEIAQALDRCAARAEYVDATPATSRQCWFLAGLILKSGDKNWDREYLLNTSKVLTKRSASRTIDFYISYNSGRG